MVSPIRLVIVGEARGVAIAERAAHDAIEAWTTTNEDLAIGEIQRRSPDAVIIGELGGPVETCHRVRAHTDAPLIVVLAGERSDARIAILDAGADDVVPRECDLPELMARVRAHVRRARGDLQPKSAVIEIGSITVDTTTRVARIEGLEVALAQNEILALRALAKVPSRPLSREQLLQAVHVNPDVAFDRSIDVIISRLRAKLGPEARRLKTIRGIGYMLVC